MRLPAGGIELDAYRAHPATGGPFPVVLVVHEIFGVHAYISDVVRRLAKSGFYAIAPNLYQRQGDPSQLASVDQIISNVVAKVPDAEVMDDLDATLGYAGASGQGDVARAAVTGFCWGGRIVWLYAAHNPKLRCGVAWYGRLVGDPRKETPKHPIDVAATLTVPVLGLYGADDTGIPADERPRHAREARRRQVGLADRDVPGRAARLPRRLPRQLPADGRQRGLEAHARLVPRARGR